ncbi:MAG: hypothetical protein GQ574_04790 [Crocinitomix sp.]|nr:hypothetical protein [Crocinitomix sp.]
MKNLIFTLLIICSGASFAQLEDYVKDYADTTYNDKNLITSITFKDSPSSEGGVATFLYYASDTVKYIGYKDHEGYAHHEYNKYGHITGVTVNHYKSIKAHYYYNYAYGDNGIINSVYTYDSTKTLAKINMYKYNEKGDLSEETVHKANKDLLSTTSYEYNTEGSLISTETFLNSGLLRLRTAAASITNDGLALRFSYTYDANGQLEKINYAFYKANGDYDNASYVLFTHENGELKTFKVSGGDYEKVKKKQLENRWIKEYYDALERNKKG